MNALFQAASEMQGFLLARNWKFCFIGGLTVLRWGEPRMTQDVDISLFVGFGGEDVYIKGLIEHFASRTPDAVGFALMNRVLLLRTTQGVAVDIALAGLPFEETVMDRASSFLFAPDCSLRTCSAEDLIVYKAFAARPKDWLDVEGVIARQVGKLDQAYILHQLEPLALAKESPDIVTKVRQMLKQ